MDKVDKSKSKKLLKLGGLHFFIAETKKSTTFYSIEIGGQLFATGLSKNEALEDLISKLPAIQQVIDTGKLDDGRPLSIFLREQS